LYTHNHDAQIAKNLRGLAMKLFGVRDQLAVQAISEKQENRLQQSLTYRISN
jgi:hypothetical protein